MENSLIHVYTGEGKGKTTCAFGLALRCAGCGFKVKIIQFLKTDETGEVSFLKDMDNIQIYRFESPHGFTCSISEEEKETLKTQIQTAVRFAYLLLENGDCDMLVLDELICAWECGFVLEEQICTLIDNRNTTELVFTGHHAPQWLIERADYVTNMQKIKHPYDKKIDARKGIEY